MNHQPKLLDPFRERAIFLNRIGIVKVAIVFAFFLLAGRSLYLQIIAHEKFSSRSEENRIHLQAIPPYRGLIKDFYGRTLATNKTVQSVFFSPATAQAVNAENHEEIIIHIADILQLKANKDELLQRLSFRNRKKQNILIKSDVSETELAQLMVRRHLLPGMVIETSSNRFYPFGEAFAHAIGYLGALDKDDIKLPQFNNPNYQGTQTIGKTGIERHYESLLHGKVGWQKVEVDARGRVHRVLSRQTPNHGEELRLGLDARLQTLAWKLMQGKRGSIVAIEPDTGRLMVLLSAPGFDPNLMVNGIDNTTYTQLISAQERPFFNRFARGRYPPASTIKPMYALMALQAGVVQSEEKIFDKGYYQVEGDDHRYRNWYRRGHGFVDLERAIRVSNDTYFFGLAERMGYGLLSQSLQKFGFGKMVSLDVFAESAAYIPSPEWKLVRFNLPWFAGDNLNMGIGQGYVLSTPLQLAAATSVLANRGRWVQPRLLLGINNKWINGWSNTSEIADISADTEHWQFIVDAMISVTSNPEGTAYKAAHALPYVIAGKTGTSQIVNISRDDSNRQNADEYKRDHALFLGFAPAVNPKIAILVIVENGGSGGSGAAPLAIKIIDSHLRPDTMNLSILDSQLK